MQASLQGPLHLLEESKDIIQDTEILEKPIYARYCDPGKTFLWVMDDMW